MANQLNHHRKQLTNKKEVVIAIIMTISLNLKTDGDQIVCKKRTKLLERRGSGTRKITTTLPPTQWQAAVVN